VGECEDMRKVYKIEYPNGMWSTGGRGRAQSRFGKIWNSLGLKAHLRLNVGWDAVAKRKLQNVDVYSDECDVVEYELREVRRWKVSEWMKYA